MGISGGLSRGQAGGQAQGSPGSSLPSPAAILSLLRGSCLEDQFLGLGPRETFFAHGRRWGLAYNVPLLRK